MSTNAYKFDLPSHHKSIIKVIGVGGGGSNAVNHMYNQGIQDVEFIVCNTDAQALKTSPVPNGLQIGLNLTEGLGAGANPEKGKDAALESKEDIRDLLDDGTKMVFVTAGMGGGTGTGAAPIIAKVARELNILTVGIVTAPFNFEGKKKMRQAEEGIRELRENCDTVLVILNDKLREIHGNLSISDAFAKADNVLTTAAKGIAEIITVPGYVNVDFQDVRTVMHNAGAAVMGSATTEGENRASRAAEAALSSPLLNTRDIHGAEKILLSIISGEQAELQMDELTEITEFIQEIAGDDAEVIFGHGVDASLGNSIRVTVIATGFEKVDALENGVIKNQENEKKVFDLDSHQQINLFKGNRITPETEEPNMESLEEQESESEESEQEPVPVPADEFSRGYFFENNAKEEEGDDLLGASDDFDVPDFEDNDQELKEDGTMGLSMKKQMLEMKARERVNSLKGIKQEDFDSHDFKEKLDVPAYQRKKVKLDNVPHSSEQNISRLSLNDENQILGNNKFLHDNVD